MISDTKDGSIKINVVKSAARRKTLQAKYDDKNCMLTVAVPVIAKDEEIREFVDRCLKKLKSRQKSERNQASLHRRALELARKYFGLSMKFKSISYTDNYTRAWGKCYTATGEICIHNRLIDFPEWVEDYVIIHELAHLIEPNHGPAFWKLAERYSLKERAVGFLMAKGIEEEEI